MSSKDVEGKKWIRAFYEPDGADPDVVHDEEQRIQVRALPDGVVPGSVWFSAEKTYQVEQFEPLKIAMGCSLPCVPEEANAAMAEAKRVTENMFGKATATIVNKMRQNGKL